MAELSAEEIAQRTLDLNLLNDRQLQEVWAGLGTHNLPGSEFTQVLVRRELLTNYQVDRLLRGERTGFFYGRYKVLYYVGAGTFARVYRAVNLDSGELVAVKVLRKRFNEDKQQREKFYREGEVGLSLRHPNIVSIYAAASDKHASYMVMEFVEGRTLRDFLKVREKFEWQEAARLTGDLVSGLDYAFQKGISHRDLKTSNVLLSSVGRAKLVDFGLAGADPNLSDEALAGLDNPRTIDYAALERATGVRKDDNRSDIYFLGCMFYHMLSGTPPLQETKDRIQRLSKTRFLDVKPLSEVAPNVPHAIAAVVNKAMAFNPDNRYQTPGEMLADLRLAERAPNLEVPAGKAGLGDAAAAAGIAVAQQPVMVVESNSQMQDTLRDALKKAGYRVLVTNDPGRPASVFADGAKPAECVVFCTTSLAEEALRAFNAFGDNSETKSIPAILLLGPRHAGWQSKAKVAKHRLTLGSPLKLKDLLELLQKLVNGK